MLYSTVESETLASVNADFPCMRRLSINLCSVVPYTSLLIALSFRGRDEESEFSLSHAQYSLPRGSLLVEEQYDAGGGRKARAVRGNSRSHFVSLIHFTKVSSRFT